MSTGGTGDDLLIGFLSVECRADRGYVGGHLVLNSRGRPIEFRCTAPVQPSRAQRVLYGPTLAPYVCGDLIADALFKSTKSKPNIIFTDAFENMSGRNGLNIPLVLVRKTNDENMPRVEELPLVENQEVTNRRFDAGSSMSDMIRSPKWMEFRLGQCDVAVSAEFQGDQAASRKLWERAGDWIDLAEPFERISEAISESLNG